MSEIIRSPLHYHHLSHPKLHLSKRHQSNIQDKIVIVNKLLIFNEVKIEL